MLRGAAVCAPWSTAVLRGRSLRYIIIISLTGAFPPLVSIWPTKVRRCVEQRGGRRFPPLPVSAVHKLFFFVRHYVVEPVYTQLDGYIPVEEIPAVAGN